MEWWDDLWLNEGFASYIEYKGMQSAEPDWDIDQQFVTMDLQPVMQIDALKSSHPIIQPVKSADEISEFFDRISYQKGASVLRMLEFVLGPNVFQAGIKAYLKK